MSRRRRFRLKPAGYLVLGILLLVIALCIYGIARAISGGNGKKKQAAAAPTATPELVTATYTPVVTETPEPDLDNNGNEGNYNTGDPVTQTTPGQDSSAEPTATPKPTATPRVPTSAEKKKAKNGVVTGDDVNLRSGPSRDYARIKKYNSGATCKIYDKDGKFYFVKMDSDGQIGFISTDYCKEIVDGSSVPSGEVPKGAVAGTVSASKLAIRKEPDQESTCIIQVTRDSKLYVYYKTGDFYYVEDAASGKKGFAYSSYVSVSGPVSGK